MPGSSSHAGGMEFDAGQVPSTALWRVAERHMQMDAGFTGGRK